MSKQIMIIILMISLVIVAANAQENPQKNSEEVKQTTQSKNEHPIDSTTEKEELVVWNKVCPVKGNPVEEDSPTVEYNGKLYGFCCPGCDTKFAKNPEKYSKNLSEDGTKFIGRK